MAAAAIYLADSNRADAVRRSAALSGQLAEIRSRKLAASENTAGPEFRDLSTESQRDKFGKALAVLNDVAVEENGMVPRVESAASELARATDVERNVVYGLCIPLALLAAGLVLFRRTYLRCPSCGRLERIHP